MATRDQRIYQEAVALWRQLYGKAPPKGLDGSALLKLITSGSEPPEYTQFSDTRLRNIVRRA